MLFGQLALLASSANAIKKSKQDFKKHHGNVRGRLVLGSNVDIKEPNFEAKFNEESADVEKKTLRIMQVFKTQFKLHIKKGDKEIHFLDEILELLDDAIQDGNISDINKLKASFIDILELRPNISI